MTPVQAEISRIIQCVTDDFPAENNKEFFRANRAILKLSRDPELHNAAVQIRDDGEVVQDELARMAEAAQPCSATAEVRLTGFKDRPANA